MKSRWSDIVISWSRVLLVVCLASAAVGQAQMTVPLIWNDDDLAEWATPLAAINTRPAHFSAAEYYAVAADSLRTYPVYPPDREPAGYWEWLQQQKPEPLVDIGSIRSTEDWVDAGRRAFREVDMVLARTADPDLLSKARDPKSFEGIFTLEDGSVLDPRWVVTERGLMLTVSDCSSCHMMVQQDDSILFAGPLGGWPEHLSSPRPAPFPADYFFSKALKALFLDEQVGQSFWRAMQTPWNPDSRIDALRPSSDVSELSHLFGGNTGTVPRFNGSPFYGVKVPDLHTLRYSNYLESTGTHRLRGPEDIARYIAKISSADPMEFGPHRMLNDAQRRVAYRHSDEALFAIGVYLLSLEPPPNPTPAPVAVIERGRSVFAAARCGECHTPPNYTNGKLTLATGYEPPASHPNTNDILRIDVGVDSGVALKTRKGTGFYKTPSLRGLWYRPFLLHDGSIASLEEFFDARRLESDFKPAGWKEPGVTTKPIQGHPFGLTLSFEEKTVLIAFLRSL